MDTGSTPGEIKVKSERGDMRYFFAIIIWLLSMSPAWADCWLQAEKMFNIESELLYAIAQQESAMKPGAIGRNRDGSTDIGLMQINSSHMKRLKRWESVKSSYYRTPVFQSLWVHPFYQI